jgi:hypothetical protein
MNVLKDTGAKDLAGLGLTIRTTRNGMIPKVLIKVTP